MGAKTVRCKFQCYEVSERSKSYDGSRLFGAKLQAVCDGSEENKAFFASTPTGSIEVSSVREAFVPGQTYYVDFTPVEG